jgi:hypothetical protein
MKFNLNEVTRKIEKQISISLSFCDLYQKSSTGTDGHVSLADLYTHVRIKVGDEVTAGLFNKVIDDMSRIGLLKVDRKTKKVVEIQYQKLMSPSELKTIGESSIHPISGAYCVAPWSGWHWLAQLQGNLTAEQAKEIVEKVQNAGVQS